MSKCIGFGEYEGKCANEAGKAFNIADGEHSYWCPRCEKLRQKYVEKQFKKIDQLFGRRYQGKPLIKGIHPVGRVMGQ